MKTRFVISALILALAVPALAATAKDTKTDHMKKPSPAKVQMHSEKGMTKSKHHKNWHHKSKTYGKHSHHMNAHKMDKKHSKTKPASPPSKTHGKHHK